MEGSQYLPLPSFRIGQAHLEGVEAKDQLSYLFIPISPTVGINEVKYLSVSLLVMPSQQFIQDLRP